MKRLFWTVIAVCAISIGAQANTLTLDAVNGNLYQQSVQSPCVFSNPACQNGSFPTTNLPTGGNVSSYDALSPVYTGAQLLSILNGGSMLLGIDINQATGQGPQTLTSFQMIKNGGVVDTFTGSTGNVPATLNGNGFADYTLSNFSKFTATDTLQFHFVFNDANDGTENVFIMGGGQVAAVPEPSTVLLLSTGLLLVGTFGRKAVRRGSSASSEQS
jgi:hypothetical protein